MEPVLIAVVIGVMLAILGLLVGSIRPEIGILLLAIALAIIVASVGLFIVGVLLAKLATRDVAGRKINPLNTRSNQQLLLAHSLTHTRDRQLAIGINQSRSEHAFLVNKMRQRGLKHRSPFVAKVTQKQVDAYRKAHRGKRRRRRRR